ncbi:MAG TPA: polyprenol monophosphomannose synthase [Vicinamibacterales bacterium]|nr:polyprenol monophosphomannose synthase [Vicinamibacterales bacterium]
MSVVVIVPTYNERENLPRLVPRILAHEGYRVLVVDDGSPDGTGEVADGLQAAHPGRVQVLHRAVKDGLGTAYVAGMRHALLARPDFVCHMDADGSHDAADLPRLVAAAETSDLVLGSRYVPGGGLRNWPWYRRALSAGANRYVRWVTGMTLRDCTAGFRCWRAEMLARIDIDALRANGYGFQVETLFRAVALGGRVREVPIVFTERTEGASKMTARIIIESAILPWQLRAQYGRLRQPAREADSTAPA